MNDAVLQKKIEHYLFALDERGYLNGAVAVGHKGQTLISEGFGKCNIQYNLTNTPSTKFKIGSITKSFTALCILQLYENDRLHINDCITKYIDFPYHDGSKITIHHLLTHSAGIPNFTSFKNYWDKDMRLLSSLPHTISTFKQRELEFKPGTKFSYSNSGYLLLTQIIESV